MRDFVLCAILITRHHKPMWLNGCAAVLGLGVQHLSVYQENWTVCS